jgi:hypothetical protein
VTLKGMSTLSEALIFLAAKCRFWSRNVMELGAAKDLRNMAAELDEKAQECKEIECPSPSDGRPPSR